MDERDQILELELDARMETNDFRLSCQKQLLKQFRTLNPIEESSKKLLQERIETTIKEISTGEAERRMAEMVKKIMTKIGGPDEENKT